MEDNKYVELFTETVRKFEENILVQQAWLEHIDSKPDRLILGKKVYEMLNLAFALEDKKNNTFHDLQIAIDCNDDYLISVCYGCKADGFDIAKKIKERF